MSVKHAWFASSFVTNAEMLTMSVSSIVEELVLNIPFGDYAIDEWAVREVIPFEPLMFKHNGHPIGREVRIVIADDTGVVFPYWPIDSLAGAKSTDGRELSLRDKAALLGAALRQTQDSDMAELAEWSQRIVRELGGAWSVDWLWCDAVRGWVLIDMALAAESWKPDAQDYGAWDECRRLAAEQEV